MILLILESSIIKELIMQLLQEDGITMHSPSGVAKLGLILLRLVGDFLRHPAGQFAVIIGPQRYISLMRNFCYITLLEIKLANLPLELHLLQIF
jgi:hypothetical protein